MIIKTPWTTQPQVACEIDRANPFGARVIDSLVGTQPYTSLGKPVTKYGTLSAGAYNGGYGYKSSGAGGLGFPCNLTNTNEITIVFEYTQHSRSGAQVLFEHSNNQNSNAGTFILYTDSASGRLHYGSSTAGTYDAGNVTAPELGSKTSVSIRLRFTPALGVADIGLSLNGVLQTTVVSNTSNGEINFGNFQTYIFGRAGTTLNADATFGGYAVLKGFATDSELVSLSANPWQIFKPLPRRIFAPVATSSDHLIIGANSSQINTASGGAIGQTHLATISNSTQANTASQGAISQSHLVTASASNQSNVASDASVSQSLIQLVTALDSTQANTASQAAINQTHLVAAVPSNQANTVSDAAIQQAHLVLSANSNQANVASPASITQALDKFVTAADSTQANTASAGSIIQTHLIQCAGVAIDNVASASAVVQGHLVGAANCVQGNIVSTGSITSGAVLFTQEQLNYLLAYIEANMAVPTTAEIAAAVLAAAQLTPIHADIKSGQTSIADAVWTKTLP